MRLREIEQVLNNEKDNILLFDDLSITNSGHVNVEKYPIFIQSVINIEKTGLIDAEVELLNEKKIFLVTQYPTIRFSKESFEALQKISKIIYFKVIGALFVIENAFHNSEEDEKSLIISLPEESNFEFETYAYIIEELNTIFSLLSKTRYFENDESVKFKNFDIGTNWIVLLFENIESVIFFSQIVSLVLVTSQVFKSNKVLDKQLEAIELDEEDKRQYQKAIREINLNMYRSKAEQVTNGEATPEELTHIAKAMEKTSNLYSAGVGFTESINASIEISKSFPNLTTQKELQVPTFLGDIKKISYDSSDENDNSDNA